MQNIQKKNQLFTTRHHDWIEYSESDVHLTNLISAVLKAENGSRAFDCIVGLSYKDSTLVEALSDQYRIPGIIHDIIGVTPNWTEYAFREQIERFQDKLSNVLGSHQSVLVVARRVIEHCSRPVEFLRSFSGIPTRLVLLFEYNNFETTVRDCKFDVVWNERASYPFKAHVDKMIQKANLQVIDSDVLHIGDESVSYNIATNYKEVRGEAADTDLIQADRMFCAYTQAWQQIKGRWDTLISGKQCKFGIVGASHKGISFSQLFLMEKSNYLLLDDSERKLGLRHPDKNIVVQAIDDSSTAGLTDVVFTIDIRWLKTVKERLSKNNPGVRVYSFEGIRL